MKPLKMNLSDRLREACQRLSPLQSLLVVMAMLMITFVLCVTITTRSILRFHRVPKVEHVFDTAVPRDLAPDSVLTNPYENGKER